MDRFVHLNLELIVLSYIRSTACDEESGGKSEREEKRRCKETKFKIFYKYLFDTNTE